MYDVRSVAVTVFKLRTRHAKTRSVLHKWGRVSSPLCDMCNEYDDVRHILMKCTKYEAQRNLFRNQIIKYFGAFTMRAIQGQAKSPEWVHRKTMLLLTKYIKSCNLYNILWFFLSLCYNVLTFIFIVLIFLFRINVSIYKCFNRSNCIKFYFYCIDFFIYLFIPVF